MTDKIYFRLLSPFVFAILICSVFAWWMGASVLANVLERRVSEQLTFASNLISTSGFPVTDSVLARMGALQRADIYKIDSSGALLVPPGVELQAVIRREIERAFANWSQQQSKQQPQKIRIGNAEYLLLFRHLETLAASGGEYIALWSDLTHIEQATLEGSRWLGLGLLFAVLVLAFIGHWIARSITQPLEELSRLAMAVAEGDRSARAAISRGDEIGVLANSLNRMAERLQAYELQVAEASRISTAGELAARVAHEIRNPLTAIIMQLEMLRESVDDPLGQRVGRLLDEARRLELITATTLQLSRPDKIDCRPENLNGLVEEVLQLMAAQFRHRRIKLETRLEPGLPQAQLDGYRIKQILFNLISNAVDELPAGGVIAVATRSYADGRIELAIEDSGGGIPLERRETLFENPDSTKPTGFGLGLHITRQLVELHNGRIEIRDGTLGGARFEITFETRE